MPHLICKWCGAPYMGIFHEHIKPICQVCNSDEFKEADIETFQKAETLEEQE